MKLYNTNLSNFASKCRLAIYEKNAKVEIAPIPGGDLKSAEYLKIYPLGKTPALEMDDGRVQADDTCHTILFDLGWPGAPHRVPRNRVVREWEAAGRPEFGSRPGEGQTVGRVTFLGQTIDVPRYSTFPPMPGFEGDVEDFCLYAGKSCGRVSAIRSAAEIVAELVHEAGRAGRE